MGSSDTSPEVDRERAGKHPSGLGGGFGRVEVVVVGGGVSGCACAAALASQGIGVTVINSALDSVGQPGYGPDVTPASGGWRKIEEVMESLPSVLREVWLDAAVAPEVDGEFFAVDRRMLSVETKRALEQVPGLGFRQGLVVGLKTVPPVRPGAGVRWSVETAFGESIDGDIVVVAVGLSLAGHVSVGRDVLPGGRYGEAYSEGLSAACEGLGAKFEEAGVEVGRRVSSGRVQSWERMAGVEPRGDDSGGGTSAGMTAIRTVPLRALLGHGLRRAACTAGWEKEGARSVVEHEERSRYPGEEVAVGSGRWNAEYPPAPYWTIGLRWGAVIVDDVGGGAMAPIVWPDGLATGEAYVSPDVAGEDGATDARRCPAPGVGEALGAVASRLSQSVRGVRIANVCPGGRLTAGGGDTYPVWVAGRAGGAEGYLESLESGVRVAEDIASAVEARGRPRRGGAG